MESVLGLDTRYGDPGRKEIGARLVKNAVYVHPHAPRVSPSLVPQYIFPKSSFASSQNGLISNSHPRHLHDHTNKDTIKSCILSSASSTGSLSSPSAHLYQRNHYHVPTSMYTSLDAIQRNDLALRPLPQLPFVSSLSSSQASPPGFLPSVNTPNTDLSLSTPYPRLHQQHSHLYPSPSFSCNSAVPTYHTSTPSVSNSASSASTSPSFPNGFLPPSLVIPLKEETSSSSRPSLSDPEASSSRITNYSFSCPSFRSGDYRIPSGCAEDYNSYQPSTSSSSCVSSDAFDRTSQNGSRGSSLYKGEQETSLTSFRHPSLGQSAEETSSPTSFESLTHHIPPLYAHAQLSDYGIRTPGEQLQQDLLRGRCQGGGCEREESHLKERSEPSNASFLFSSSSPSHYHDEPKRDSSFNHVDSSLRARGSTKNSPNITMNQNSNRYPPKKASFHEKKSSSSSVSDQSLIYRWIPKVITSIFEKKTEDKDADNSTRDENVKERQELVEKRNQSQKERFVKTATYYHQGGDIRRKYFQGRGVEGEQGMKNKQQERERNHVYVWKEKTKENEVIQQDDITNSLCSHNQETSPTTTRPFSFAYDETVESRMENTRLFPTIQETSPRVFSLPQVSFSASPIGSSSSASISPNAGAKDKGENFFHEMRKNNDGVVFAEQVPLPSHAPGQKDLGCHKDLIYRFWPFHGVSPSKLPADCPPPPPHHRFPDQQTFQLGQSDLHQKIEAERLQSSTVHQPPQNSSFYEGSFYPSGVGRTLYNEETRRDGAEKEVQVGEENHFSLPGQMNEGHLRPNLHAQQDSCYKELIGEEERHRGGEDLGDKEGANVGQEMDTAFSQQQSGRPSTPEFAGGESPVSPYQTEEAELEKGSPLVGEGRGEGEDSPGFGIHRPNYHPASYTPSYHSGETSLGEPTYSNIGISQDNRHQPQPHQQYIQVDTLGTIPVNSTEICPSPLPFPVLGYQEKMTKNEGPKGGLINKHMNSLSPCISPQDKNVPLPMEKVHSQERVDPTIFPACFSFNLSCPVLPENERPQQSVLLQKHQDQETNEIPLEAENLYSQNLEECLSSFPDISSPSSYAQERDNRTATTFEDCVAVASDLPGHYSTGKHPTGICHEKLHPSLGSSYQTKNEMTMRSETQTNSTEDMKVFGEKEQEEESKKEGEVLVQEQEKNYQTLKIENGMNPLHSHEGPPSQAGEKKGTRMMKNSVIYIDNHILRESCATKLSSCSLPEPQEKRGREREGVVLRSGGPVEKYITPSTTTPGGDSYGDTRAAYVPKTDDSEQPLRLYPSPNLDSQDRNSTEEVNPAVRRRKQQLLQIMKSQEQAEEKAREEQEEAKKGKGEVQGIQVDHQPKQMQEQRETPIALKKQVDQLLLRNTQAQAILEGIKNDANVEGRGTALKYQKKEKDEEIEKEKTGGEHGLESWEERFERKLLSTGEYALCKQCDGVIKLAERQQERDGMKSAPISLVHQSHKARRQENDETEEEKGVFCRCSSSCLSSFPHSQSHPHYPPAENTYEDSHTFTNTHKTLSYASHGEKMTFPSFLDFDNKEIRSRKDLDDERSEREMPRIRQEKQVVYGDHIRNEKEKANPSLKGHRGSQDWECSDKNEEEVQGREEVNEEEKFSTMNSGDRRKKTGEVSLDVVLEEKTEEEEARNASSCHAFSPLANHLGHTKNATKERVPATVPMRKMTEEKGVGTSPVPSDRRGRDRDRYPSPPLIRRNVGEGQAARLARYLPYGGKAIEGDDVRPTVTEEILSGRLTREHEKGEGHEDEENKITRGSWLNDKNPKKKGDVDVDVVALTKDEDEEEKAYSHAAITREGRHPYRGRSPASFMPKTPRPSYTNSITISSPSSSTWSPVSSPSIHDAYDGPRRRPSHCRSMFSKSHSISPRGPHNRMISSSSSPPRKALFPGSTKTCHLHPNHQQTRGYASCGSSPRCQQQGLMSTLNFNRMDAAELAAKAWPGENAGDAWRIQERRRKQELQWMTKRKELEDLVEEQQWKLNRLLEERAKRQKEEEEQQQQLLFLQQRCQRELGEASLNRSGTSGNHEGTGGGMVWTTNELGCPVLLIGGEEKEPLELFKELLPHVFPGQSYEQMVSTAKTAVDENQKEPSVNEESINQTQSLLLQLQQQLQQLPSDQEQSSSTSSSHLKDNTNTTSSFSSSGAYPTEGHEEKMNGVEDERIHECAENNANEPHEHQLHSRRSSKEEENYMKKKNGEEEVKNEAQGEDRAEYEEDENHNHKENKSEKEEEVYEAGQEEEEDREEQEESEKGKEEEQKEREGQEHREKGKDEGEKEREKKEKSLKNMSAYAKYLHEFYNIPWTPDSDDTERYLHHKRQENLVARTNGIAVRDFYYRRNPTATLTGKGAGAPAATAGGGGGAPARAGVNEGIVSGQHHLNNSTNASDTSASRRNSATRGYSNVSSGVSTAPPSQVHHTGVRKVQQVVEEGMPVHPYIKPTRSVLARPMPWDTIDQALADLHNSHSGQQSWKKINRGIYKYGKVQVTLSFIGNRLTAQQDNKNEDFRLVWNKGARGDVLKFISYCDSKEIEEMTKLQEQLRRSLGEDFQRGRTSIECLTYLHDGM